jgi:hypothetical protein
VPIAADATMFEALPWVELVELVVLLKATCKCVVQRTAQALLSTA